MVVIILSCYGQVDFRQIKKKIINIFRLKGTLIWFMEEEASVSWVWSLKLSMMVAAMCWGNSLASGLPLPLSFLFILSSHFPFFCCRVIPKTLMPREVITLKLCSLKSLEEQGVLSLSLYIQTI